MKVILEQFELDWKCKGKYYIWVKPENDLTGLELEEICALISWDFTNIFEKYGGIYDIWYTKQGKKVVEYHFKNKRKANQFLALLKRKIAESGITDDYVNRRAEELE